MNRSGRPTAPKAPRKQDLPGFAQGLEEGPPLALSRHDPFLSRLASWRDVAGRFDEAQHQWQTCETALFARARSIGMDCELACKSSLPEARRLRGLGSDLDDLQKALEALTKEILQIPAASIVGALAKIEMGVEVQGGFDWRDHARELVESGLSELRALLPPIPIDRGLWEKAAVGSVLRTFDGD